MAKICSNCKSMFNSKLENCPRDECVELREKEEKVVQENKIADAPHRKRVRRPLRRGKFTR